MIAAHHNEAPPGWPALSRRMGMVVRAILFIQVNPVFPTWECCIENMVLDGKGVSRLRYAERQTDCPKRVDLSGKW
jgi:hypothetical protein